jgi:hypothetical protein
LVFKEKPVLIKCHTSCLKIGGIEVALPHKTTKPTKPLKISPMEQTTAPSTKGKGLGTAGMVIGIIALVWSVIPLAGAAAIWLALPGFILSLVAFFMAKGGNNPKKGMIITGIILNVVALGLAIYWIMAVASAVGDMSSAWDAAMDSAKMKMDTMNMH